MTAFLKNAAIRSALTAIFVPALIILFGMLASIWSKGTFTGDYIAILAVAAGAVSSGVVSWLTQFSGGDPTSGKFTK